MVDEWVSQWPCRNVSIRTMHSITIVSKLQPICTYDFSRWTNEIVLQIALILFRANLIGFLVVMQHCTRVILFLVQSVMVLFIHKIFLQSGCPDSAASDRLKMRSPQRRRRTVIEIASVLVSLVLWCVFRDLLISVTKRMSLVIWKHNSA